MLMLELLYTQTFTLFVHLVLDYFWPVQSLHSPIGKKKKG